MKARLSTLTQGERLVLIGGLLLIVDLLFLPWHSVDLGDLDIAFDTTRTGVQAPNGTYGIVALVLTVVMVAQILISSLTPLRVPAPGMPWGQIHLLVGIFVAVILVIKLFKETELLGFGAYSGVLAGLLVGYGAYRIGKEAELRE